jgi:ribosomal protein S18 acetylase RimI-like enzyme
VIVIRGPEVGRIGIVKVDPELPPELMTVRARQVSDMMRRVQTWYMAPKEAGGLGLRRIDTDPPPDPRDNKHVAWRIGRLRDPMLHHVGAFTLDNSGSVGGFDDSMVGYTVLRVPKDSEVELVEWDVDGAYRRRHLGLGRAMLQAGVGLARADRYVLDVAAPNVQAIEIYERYGFTPTGHEGRHDEPVFDVVHRQYAAPGPLLYERLGGFAACEALAAQLAA